MLPLWLAAGNAKKVDGTWSSTIVQSQHVTATPPVNLGQVGCAAVNDPVPVVR